tara:strand:- start:4951 stop:5223 length:273 start_codon:yes stop_codon:yes gene_type:complete
VCNWWKKGTCSHEFPKKKLQLCSGKKGKEGEKSSVFFEKTFLFELFGSYYLIDLPYKFYALAHVNQVESPTKPTTYSIISLIIKRPTSSK